MAATGERTAVRRTSVAGPLGVAGGAALACAYVGAVDPSTHGAYLRCPLHAATGLWCPVCGVTRALHSLLHGNVTAAISANLFLPVVAVLAVWAWLAWLSPKVPRMSRVLPQSTTKVLVVAALVFGVARNLPVFQALAP